MDVNGRFETGCLICIKHADNTDFMDLRRYKLLIISDFVGVLQYQRPERATSS
jgi:hypothetical protein